MKAHKIAMSALSSHVLGNFMINVDLTSTWDWKTNISETTTSITANPRTGSLPPRVVRGTPYQGALSDKRIFLYGGTISSANTSFPGWRYPDASTYPLWSFNTNNTDWDQYTTGTNVTNRPSSGAAAEAPDQGLAFYFDGLIDNGSSSTAAISGATNVNTFLPGMIVINLADLGQDARNLSTSALTGAEARARGQMQYVPDIGENGILVQLGGSSKAVTERNDLELVNTVTSAFCLCQKLKLNHDHSPGPYESSWHLRHRLSAEYVDTKRNLVYPIQPEQLYPAPVSTSAF